jgi:TIR domain
VTGCAGSEDPTTVKAVLTMAFDVFISHSTKDKTVADAACATLEARGIRCWIAPRDVPPAQEWAAALVEAVQECEIFLLVFSHEAKASPQVRREVAQAANSGKQILTLRIEDVLPEADLKFYLDGLHWLDAISKPFKAHLQRLADACAALLAWLHSGQDAATRGPAPQLPSGEPDLAWWRRQPMKAALIAAVVVVLTAGAGVTGLLLRPSAAHAPPPSPVAAPPAPPIAAPAAPPNPAGNTDPRAQIVQLTGSWSEKGFIDSIVNRDTSIVALYLKSGMKATTVSDGASAILYGFQGVSQNGDPVDLVKTFQASGFKVDDPLQDSGLVNKLTNHPPPVFDSPLAPKGYEGGMFGKFVGSLLFWIVQRSTADLGLTDQDNQVVNYLIGEGADCKVPLAYLKFSTWLSDYTAYKTLFPMLQTCAK